MREHLSGPENSELARRSRPRRSPLRWRGARSLLSVAVACCLGFSLLPSVASADNLDQRRQQVQAELDRSQQDLGESSIRLSRAAVAVQSARDQLTGARQRLTGTQQELVLAQGADVAVAARLKLAQAGLARARAAVSRGQRQLHAEQSMAGALARDQYQQQTSLLPIAMLLQSQSMAELQTRLQWSTTMFDTTQAEITRLSVLQQALTADRARQSLLEQQVAGDRRQAAAIVVVKQRLERQAASQTTVVAALVRQRFVVQASAARAVAVDRQQLASLNRERASVEHRIAVRIAAAKAAAARKAAAMRAARLVAQRAEAARRAQQADAARRAQQAETAARQRRAARSTPAPSNQVEIGQPPSVQHVQQAGLASAPAAPRVRSSSGHHGFLFPVGTQITSPYGRRFHPILHIWKLHDGTDFGASCGTPIHAAYSGLVAERYFNPAYGNRLMIDHGLVDGRYVTTGYNHAERYQVHVGQHVSKGQVIGYVGATGYATGCHLHLMVWLDGRRVNPMSWY